jgi:hypothetical protein
VDGRATTSCPDIFKKDTSKKLSIFSTSEQFLQSISLKSFEGSSSISVYCHTARYEAEGGDDNKSPNMSVLNSFLSTFLDVRTFLTHESIFVTNIEKCDTLLSTIFGIDWSRISPDTESSLLTTSDKSTSDDDNLVSESNTRNVSLLSPTVAKTPLEMLMQITRIFSRTGMILIIKLTSKSD